MTTEIEIARIYYSGFLPEDEVGLDDDYEPIEVEPDADGDYQLVDGYHRLAAAKHDGLIAIRAICQGEGR